ncbi:hypothetical protein PVAP13_8NG203702 [Panicum virgatum]|uniref:Uncharacterized protein n=1 Tax=Panicum virgatum TaxID=38727 RepID=A0A8T0P4F7_PANVG|nr:hypothetical protein PVAP13_8NG203702 [Panicum virgatum]
MRRPYAAPPLSKCARTVPPLRGHVAPVYHPSTGMPHAPLRRPSTAQPCAPSPPTPPRSTHATLLFPSMLSRASLPCAPPLPSHVLPPCAPPYSSSSTSATTKKLRWL